MSLLKKEIIVSLVIGLLVGYAIPSMYPNLAVDLSKSSAGNGAPSGTHYNLNLIGVPKGKTAKMTADTGCVGSTIFVNLDGTSKINLAQSTDGTFCVVDKNGTDANGASFMLPAPGTYAVYAAAKGKPGGTSKIGTCATSTYTDPTTGTTTSTLICSTTNEISVKNKGQNSYKNVTNALTSISIDPDLAASLGTTLTCTSSTVSLFDPCLQNYFWSYDNNGLKNLSLRFYPI